MPKVKTSSTSRLGLCGMCNQIEAKYTCPQCEIVTCGLACVKSHKQKFECEGIRSKTRFVPTQDITDLDILSDYRLLEELSRVADACTRDGTRKLTRKDAPLPFHLQKFRKAVYARHSKIYFLPKNFSRHKDNTSFLDRKNNRISWKLSVTFLHAQKYTITVDRCPEDTTVETIVEKCLKTAIERKKVYKKHFEAYQASKSDTIVLMQAEKLPEAQKKCYVLDMKMSLKENLAGKRIVEHPTLYVGVNRFFAAEKSEALNNKSKTKLNSLLFSTYSLQEDKDDDLSSSDEEKEIKDKKQESDSENEDSIDEAFDLLDTGSYKELLSSLYKT